jgi:serine/threonine-protein kinase
VLEVPGKAGQVIAERYVLEEIIGRGGMGSVWRAKHRTLKTDVAIKLLAPALAAKEEALARFHREALSAATLKGSNVVTIYDHGVDAGVPYIAMELLEGESLGSRIRREKKLTPLETALVLRGVTRAVERAHRAGIVHRDLKPDNVFLVREEDQTSAVLVKVLDFGIAKLVEDHSRLEDGSTRTGAMLGTPFYMSPEQARGKKDLDARSDLWSIAVMASECLTGHRAFHADMLGELVMQICSEPIRAPSSFGEVPPGFDAWFERATQRDPAKRFQSARELANALGEVLTPGSTWMELRGDSLRGSTSAPPELDSGRISSPSDARPPSSGSMLSPVSTPAISIGSASLGSVPPAFSSAPSASQRTPNAETQAAASRSIAPVEKKNAPRAVAIGGGLIIAFAVTFLVGQRMSNTPAASNVAVGTAAPVVPAVSVASVASTVIQQPPIPVESASSDSASNNPPAVSASASASAIAPAVAPPSKPPVRGPQRPTPAPARTIELGI